MSVTTPAHLIPRWSVVGMEGMFAKMFDPPTDSPATPDLINPTNPVPEVMVAAGFQNPLTLIPHTTKRDLLHGVNLPTWDGAKNIAFFTFTDPDNPATINGNWPAATIRVPRGAIYHCLASGKGPPPHTIHWHGIEPTPINDGVGHCSMEIGGYTYQWQPNFIGTYFCHCHRNTMQHFEFGLYGMLLIDPPDAYFATQWDPTIPIGCGRDGKRRTAANLTNFPQFPDFVGGDIRDPDPEANNPLLPASLKFATNPHAMTIAYDVEALWVPDDRDSVWSDLGSNARATYPRQGNTPGIDDEFDRNPGVGGFFAFNDFHADYWFITGVPVPAPKGGIAAIPANLVVPPELNSGVSGQQVSINASVNQTILVRCLDAAYNSLEITFPVDIVIIAWDGRALGVAPFGFNEAYAVPANTPIRTSTARRFDALIRSSVPFDGVATIKFINTRGEAIHAPIEMEEVVCTAQIPISIVSGPAVTLTPSVASPQATGTLVSFAAITSGGTGPFEYRFWRNSGTGYEIVQEYGPSNTLNWTPTVPGAYDILVDVRTQGSTEFREALAKVLFFQVFAAAATGVTLIPDVAGPQPLGTTVTFTAAGQGGGPSYEYRFWVNSGSGFNIVQDYSTTSTFAWTPLATGAYDILVDVRSLGSTAFREASIKNFFYQITAAQATGVTLIPNLASPRAPNTTITFTAAGQGGSGSYEYRFWVNSGAGFNIIQDYSNTNTFPWTPTAIGNYDILVDVRNAGSTAFREALTKFFFYQIQ